MQAVKIIRNYDVAEILTRWGNWARLGAYWRYKCSTIRDGSESQKNTDVLSDNDAEFISQAVTVLGNSNCKDSKLLKKVLIYYYYGDEFIVDGAVVIKPLNIRDIANKMDLSLAKTSNLKDQAESFIVGTIESATLLTGKTMNILETYEMLK